MLAAVESTRTLPTNRLVFSEAKIVNVMEGIVEVETACSTLLLTPGDSMVIAPGCWYRVRPRSHTRLWTVYVDDRFLRVQMGWLLPDRTRVRLGVHPQDWNGDPLLLHPGMPKLQLVEPLWRQMSLLHDDSPAPEAAAVRAIELFARWVGIVAQTFLKPEVAALRRDAPDSTTRAIRGRLSDTATLGQVGCAVRLLKERMVEQWTVAALAKEVALSRAHMTRLFILRTGIAPIQFLTEVRLTEFTRLIEETEISVARASHSVGWVDPRIASSWFHRRFGVTPSQYRLTPHPHHVDRNDGDPQARKLTPGRDEAIDAAYDA